MQFLKYNRTAAAVALAIIVVLSIFFGVNRSISSLGKAVERAYTDTEASSDLAKYAAHAQQFSAIYAALYEENADMQTAIASLRASLSSPLGETERLAVVSSLAAEMYYTLSLDKNAEEAAKNSAMAYYYEMQSTLMRLGNNTEYDAAAKKYNDTISAFPASVLSPGRAPAIRFD